MLDFAIQGVIFLIGGIYLVVTTPSLVYADKVNLITWVFCTVSCIAGGLSYLGVAPDAMYMASLVGCAVTIAGVTYLTLDATLAQCYGFHLPMGKPIKEMGDWSE